MSTLETALLLAQRCDGYIEGFPLRSRVRDFVALDPIGSLPMATYEHESQEEAIRARTFFEVFMQERNVPSRGETTQRPSWGWLNDAAEGEDFVGSYGRVFDVRAGPGCLNRFSASISGTSAMVRLPSGRAAVGRRLDWVSCRQGSNVVSGHCRS